MIRGTNAHREIQGRWAKEGFATEHWLGRIGGKGNRIDGFKIERLANGERVGILRELKPNTQWGRTAGYQQLTRYLNAAQKKYPSITRWVQELHLYEGANTITGLLHTVEEGSNLTEIAEMYGTTVETLVQLNNISNPDEINTGEELLIDFMIEQTIEAEYEPLETDKTNVVLPEPIPLEVDIESQTEEVEL
ncbi:MAG: LysM peptidoglycan-binding domain-containing protein [Leptolyngbya sp. SIO3F4]|nr:LysM peptidoglycan-binding domain-containing protein [Leptolyngbya sp. SIO3F4]